jgi:HK97 family phage portal protein
MFLSFRASRDETDDFWFQPVAQSVAGVRVGPDQAMRHTAVFACVRLLAESFAVLPFSMYRPRTGDRGRDRVTDHWLHRLFARRPNRFQTPFEWREMIQGHLALRGNGFNQIVPDGKGGIAELMPMHPDRVSIELLDNGSHRYRYSPRNGGQVLLRRDEVWHLRGLSSDGIAGLSPLELAREAIGMGLSAQSYASRFFANDAKPTAGWIESPAKFGDKANREKFRESVQEAIGGSNRHKLMVLDRGMKYHEVGPNNKDSQFLESRQANVTDIARMFRVPPHKIADLTRSTNNNIEHQDIEFYKDTMLPWTERWESSIKADLLGDDSDLEVEFDFSRMLRGDAKSRAEYAHAGVLDGWLLRNEARELEGYDPIDGLDEPLVPVNMRGIHDPLPQPGAARAPNDASARLAGVLRGNAARMARRIAAGNAPSTDVLADALAISKPVAETWLELSLAGFSEAEIAASLVELGERYGDQE